MFRHIPVLVAAVLGCISCTTQNANIKAVAPGEYVPSYERISGGRRPILPIFGPEVTFHQCQTLTVTQMADIIENFTQRFSHGPYCLYIHAIVVCSPGEICDTMFTLWLEDGRRLDSGFMFFEKPYAVGYSELRADFDEKMVGRQLYARAMQLLHKAIPEVKVSPAFAADQ